jgi:Phage T7 capsid assembly protein
MTDTTNATPAQPPVPGSPEHDAALAAVFDSRQNPDGAPASQPATPATPAPQAQAQAQVPDYIPEKFRSAADPMKAMAEAYAALESKQAAPQTPQTPPANDDAKAQVQAAGIDFDGLSSKYQQNGALDAADYSALEKAGIPKVQVDAYIAGQEALAQSIRNDVFSSVGGEAKFTAMADWAAKSVPASELKAFNEVMDTGSVEQIKLAVAGLNSKFVASVGNEPNLLGGRGGNTPTDVFRSVQELTAAMRDPLYAKDPAYRADVEAKLARSSIM